MASLTDSALILIICLFIFLILSLLTNGVFFSISLFKNIRSKPKDNEEAKKRAKKSEPAYVEMSGRPDSYAISPYYTEMGPSLQGAPDPSKQLQSPYANLADMPN